MLLEVDLLRAMQTRDITGFNSSLWGREKVSTYVHAEKKGGGWIQERQNSSIGNPSPAQFLLKSWKPT